MDLAFVGLGNMGAGMARNLLRAGHRIALYNRTREKAEAVVSGAEGGTATVADSPAGAAANAEAVFTMLADDAGPARMHRVPKIHARLPRFHHLDQR